MAKTGSSLVIVNNNDVLLKHNFLMFNGFVGAAYLSIVMGILIVLHLFKNMHAIRKEHLLHLENMTMNFCLPRNVWSPVMVPRKNVPTEPIFCKDHQAGVYLRFK